jgi:hypothetical protein
MILLRFIDVTADIGSLTSEVIVCMLDDWYFLDAGAHSAVVP